MALLLETIGIGETGVLWLCDCSQLRVHCYFGVGIRAGGAVLGL